METFKRHIAYKMHIEHILKNKYVKEEDQFTPNYLVMNGAKVSRVNVMAVVVEKQQEFLDIDDGTGRIHLRSFEPFSFDHVAIGDSVLVIGKPREYNNERYIVPEIVSKIDPRWLAVRKSEIGEVIVEKEEIPDVVDEVIEDPTSKVYQMIKTLDQGDGVEVEKILAEMKIEEKVISSLLKEGEIFEIRPGRLKVLE